MELQTLQEALKVEIQIHQVRGVSRLLGQWVRRRLRGFQVFKGEPGPERPRPDLAAVQETEHPQTSAIPASQKVSEPFSLLVPQLSAAQE